MKLSPHRNFPRLGKWVPFFQQEKRTLDYKDIDATKLQKICTFIDHSEGDIKAESEPCSSQHSFRQHSGLPRTPPNRFEKVDRYIKKSGLKKHITLETFPDSPSNKPKITGVFFRNFKIKGDIKIFFSDLKKIKFLCNVFTGHVDIFTRGTNQTVLFNGNKFSKSFGLFTTNTFFVSIRNNDISDKMNMYFTFTPLPHDSSNYRIKKILHATQLDTLFIIFFKNKFSHLNINDISDASDWHQKRNHYPLEDIRFTGGNRIKALKIETMRTTLTSYSQLKSNINSISFRESDKIEFSTLENNPASKQDIRDPLIYGKFFSLLEAQTSERHDQMNEEMYMRKVRYFYKKFSPRWEDRFIFIWIDWISQTGTSWFRPLLLLVTTQTLLATIAYYSFAGYDLHLDKECILHWDTQCNPHIEKGWGPFGALVAWFMNPASLLPSIPITMTSWPIYLLFLCHKFFAAVFYYEIVKALRRFFKRAR